MTPTSAAALLSSLLSLLLLAAPAGAEVRERILAVVDDRPILLTEVRVVERVLGLDTAGALEKLIDEWLMFREAARIPQAAVAAEVEEALRERLARRDLSERIEAWVKELRAGAEIRYNP
jgi:hypothetical protein